MKHLEEWRRLRIESITHRAKSEKALVEAEYQLMLHNAGCSAKPDQPKSEDPAGAPICVKCQKALVDYTPPQGGKVWTAADQAEWSKKQFGEVLCFPCRPKKRKQ